MTLSARNFEAVAEFFHESSGIRLGPDKHALVQGRLQRLAHEHGQRDIDGYVSWVLSGESPEELTRMVDRLTTNETYFFREPEHFQFLGRLLAQRQAAATFRVWSGASSTGEEAYSIGMVLQDRLGLNRPWEIVGTDLSTSVVATARRGLYGIDRAESIPAYYRQRFCLRGNGAFEGKMLVAKSLRERTTFLSANLLEDLPDIGMFDVIFLRNVLIYFDVALKADIVKRVLAHLKPDGYLFAGHSESLSNLDLPLRTVQTAVYQHA